jgi:ribosomal protein S18 acetylase RimI-like enzyme
LDWQALDMQLRRATFDDIDIVVVYVLAMLDEMAELGGHPVAEAGQASAWLRQRCAATIEDPDHLFLLAEAGEGDVGPIGLIEARATHPLPVFQTRGVLHIHSVYVLPDYRRRGVGRQLLQGALEWGRAQACVEAELSTLCTNPARQLYESLGFVGTEVEMRRSL